MGAEKYKNRGRTFWKVDDRLVQPNGEVIRLRKRMIPTKEQAEAYLAKQKAAAFEGRYFDKVLPSTMTVAEAWNLYKSKAERDNDTYSTDRGRADHLMRHLGKRIAASLTVEDVDAYRNARLKEITKRKGPPAPATLDNEVELLKRFLNYAVKCQRLPVNPIASASLLKEPNTREVMVNEEQFNALLAVADQVLKPVLLVGFDTGMRRTEILRLRRTQFDLTTGALRLPPQDTKTNKPRVVYLTTRTLQVLKALPRHIRSEFIFVNPRTGKPWWDLRKRFLTAAKAAGLEGLWYHDLRRSFVTKARRSGIPESIVMRMSGHRTRSVFDRYNVIDEDDLREAVKRLEGSAAALDTDIRGQETVKV